MTQRDIVDGRHHAKTHHVLPADMRQVTDRRPQTHLLTSQNHICYVRLSINGYIDPLTPTCIDAFTRSKFPASLHSLIHCFIASLFASSSQGLLPWNNARGRLSPQASCIWPRSQRALALSPMRTILHDEQATMRGSLNDGRCRQRDIPDKSTSCRRLTPTATDSPVNALRTPRMRIANAHKT